MVFAIANKSALYVVLCMLLAVSACKNREQKQQEQLTNDRNTCGMMGFDEDSVEYSNCLMEQRSYRMQNQMMECQRVKMQEANNNRQYNSAAASFFGGMARQMRINKACDF